MPIFNLGKGQEKEAIKGITSPFDKISTMQKVVKIPVVRMRL